MPTEEIKWLLDAEDKATAKIRKVNQTVEAEAKQIKAVGGQAKASTELVGTLAVAMGGSGIGEFAGQLAMTTERLSAFSEVAETGTAGMFALKAGILAAAGAISFNLGKSLGNAVFKADEFKDKMDELDAKVEKHNDGVLAFAQRRFEAAKASDRAVEFLDQESAALTRRIQEGESLLKHLEKTAAFMEISEQGKISFGADDIAIAEANLDQLRERQKLLFEQRQEFEKLRQAEKDQAEETRRTEQLEQQKRLQETIFNTQLKIAGAKIAAPFIELDRAIKSTIKSQAEAERKLVRERDAATKRQELEKQRIVALEKSITDQMRIQATEMLQGKETAEILRLTLAGIDEATARTIASQRVKLDELAKAADATAPSAAGRVGSQDQRLLAGRGERQRDKMLAQTTKTTELNQNQVTLLESILDALETPPAQQLLAVLGD